MIRTVSTVSAMLILGGFVLASTLASTATASDVAKEGRWAEQVIDGLLDGDAVWMDDGTGHEFLGVLTEGDSESGRAVVLMHGIGVHPNWPDVIYPLRVGLLEQEVTTLSIQMPILPNEAESAEYLPLFAEVPGRIDAALQTLNAAGYSDITLVAHSMGAAMTVYYLAEVPSADINSVIIIGMGPGIEGNESIDRLRQIELPLLDLYGSEDLEDVRASADERAAAGGANAGYRQLRVPAANHFFQGQESALVQQVSDWLTTQAVR